MKSLKVNSHICGIKTGLINIINEESTFKSLMALNLGTNFCQIIPANTVTSFFQVFAALEQTYFAFISKTSFSKKKELEFLLRFYGTKQINKALKMAQLNQGKNKVILICAQKNKKSLSAFFKITQKKLKITVQDFSIGKNKKELMKLYNVTEKELKTLNDQKNPLEKIVVEKNSLVVFES